MKLAEHVDKLRNLIEAAFDKHFARLGVGKNKQLDIEKLPENVRPKRLHFVEMLKNHIGETGDYEHAREKLIDELTFTLFNRLAAVKVMEAGSLFPPVLTKQTAHGDRSFGHRAWLEINPHMRSEELEGIREYLKYAFDELGETLPLYSKAYPYALLPDAISLNEIIDAFNAVEKDSQVGSDIWQSDDVLGWMYESYNNEKKKAHKESGDKTEYNKVSLQSQVYTPRWVVQFLVENSLGKLYLEMYPDSEIKRRYKIANAPQTQERKPKPLHKVRIIDPACGSGNFLLYAFDFFYELYVDQIDNYGAYYDEKDIPKLIIEKNLHGIDLDDRAVQLAQLGLIIKAKKKRRTIGELAFNVVSSDFYLPEYETVEHIFTEGTTLDKSQQELIAEIWNDLQYAYKFGSLIRLDEKVKAKLKMLEAKQSSAQPELFTAMEIAAHKDFAATFFTNLKTAVEQYAQAQGNTFLTSKTRDAITFLELLTTEYDVATANPPYTSADTFGKEIKSFVEKNYKKPQKFNKNLYACFLKRCCEFVVDVGYVAMVHPQTFMYISDFKDVREYILNSLSIEIFVEWGYLGMFNPSARVDSVLYIFKKAKRTDQSKSESVFIKLNHLYETKRYDALFEAYEHYLAGTTHPHLYIVSQEDLRAIKNNPFIYWISDSFRSKFSESTVGEISDVALGLKTANNNKYLRFFWEVDSDCISSALGDKKKWVTYLKGGAFNKWYGNEWLVVEWANDGQNIKNQKNSQQIEKGLSFRPGVTLATRSVKGVCARSFKENCLFDMAASSVIYRDAKESNYWLAYANSKLFNYILSCLNPTVNKQPEDIRRLPAKFDKCLDISALTCESIKRQFASFDLLSKDYISSPLTKGTRTLDWNAKLRAFFSYENYLSAQILINEAIINQKIFEVYDLTEHDKAMVLTKEGESIGGLPVTSEARDAYLAEVEATKEFPLDDIRAFIEALPTKKFTAEEREAIESGFGSLYQSSNDLEEFCIRHQVNPINVWYWFKQSNIIPQQRKHTLAMEFLADMVREILIEDEDGIIPLVPNAGEKVLLDRIEEKFREKGFSSAQYSSFDTVLGCSIHEYLNKYFFSELSDHLNLFQYLPKTPFIWHLSSGPEQGFDCYLIIYKWSRDKLMRLRSVYIEHRERSLVNRQSDLSGNESAEAQNEKDRIFRQLEEIEEFKKKSDELLAEGYDPILDDGVGKNIAPLQKKGMIPYEVLNAGQLKKYLNADW
jgi:type I restriction-modification system DNA methylase subunit